MKAREAPLALSQHRAVTLALILGLSMLVLSGVASRAQADSSVPSFVPRQVVVELASAASLPRIKADYDPTKVENLPQTDIYLLHLRAEAGVTDTVSQMKKDKRLSFAEPNFVIRPLEGEARHRAWGISDNEPSLQDDAASALNLSMAHNFSEGLGSTVAVLDTGVQRAHPALQPNLEGVKGYDFVRNNDDPSDSPDGSDCDSNGEMDEMWGHGTHVAGIVDRVAPAAKIMPLRVLNADGCGDAFAIAEAIIYAKRNGAHVINLSLGSSSKSNVLRKTIQDATKKDRTKNGVVVVAAAGNSDSSERYYPAAGNGGEAPTRGLVAVTSVDNLGRKSSFANYGSWVDVAAPGEGIRSTLPNNVYANWSGTSMATPFVSGEAALIRARAVPGLQDPAGVEERILCSAQSLVLTDSVYGSMLGAGRADVGASLTPEGACPETTITAGPTGLINSASVVFDFSSSEVGSTFECSLDSEAPADYSACSSPKDYAGLADGSHTFYVKATDATGDVDASPAQRSFRVDATGPNTAIESGPEGLTNDDTPSYSWSGSDNFTTDGNLLYSWRLGNGEWSTYSAGTSVTLGGAHGLTDGSYTFQVRARDQAGNVDLSPAERNFTVDTAAPDAPVISNPANDGYDNDSDFTVSGTAEEGSTVELFERSNPTGKVIADANGGWGISFTGVAEGSHTYTAEATDAAGNTSLASNARTVVVDTTVPGTTIDDGLSGTVSSASATFAFSSSEAGSTFECSLDNTPFTSCTPPKSYSGLADGQHAFSVRATDAAGNTDATPASRTWTVDTTAPVVTIDSKPASLTNNASPSFGFSSDDADSAFECSLSQVAQPEDFEPCSSAKSYGPLSDGSYTFNVRATDAAGNTGAAPPYSFELDVTQPAAPSRPDLMATSDTGSSSTDDVTSDDTPTFAGTAEANSTVELFANGNSLGTAGSDQSGNWSITIPDAKVLAAGPHQIAAKATDRAGNTSPSSDGLSVIVDTTAPAVEAVAPADGATGVTLIAEIEATFSEAMDPATLYQNTFTLVEQGSTTPIEATVTYDGATKKATLAPDTDLRANATYTATLNTGAVDAAGNPLATNVVWSFTTAAPVS